MRRVLGEDRRAYHRSVLASRPTHHQRINMRMLRKGGITLRTEFLMKEKAQHILAQCHFGLIMELELRKGEQGLARRGIVSGRARGPIREEGAVRNKGRRGAGEEPPEGVRRLEAPAVVEMEVIVEVAVTATFARTRRMVTTWTT